VRLRVGVWWGLVGGRWGGGGGLRSRQRFQTPFAAAQLQRRSRPSSTVVVLRGGRGSDRLCRRATDASVRLMRAVLDPLQCYPCSLKQSTDSSQLGLGLKRKRPPEPLTISPRQWRLFQRWIDTIKYRAPGMDAGQRCFKGWLLLCCPGLHCCSALGCCSCSMSRSFSQFQLAC